MAAQKTRAKRGLWWGAMSYHNPPPHPHDDNAPDRSSKRLSPQMRFHLRWAACWLVGWFVFAPWFANLFNNESSWSPFPLSWPRSPSFRFLGWLVWLAIVLLVWLVWPLVERRERRRAEAAAPAQRRQAEKDRNAPRARPPPSIAPAILYLRRSRFFRSIMAADVAVSIVIAAWPGTPGRLTALPVGVVVFVAARVGFEKWCQRKGWGELSDYPEDRRQKDLRFLLNLLAYSLLSFINLL